MWNIVSSRWNFMTLRKSIFQKHFVGMNGSTFLLNSDYVEIRQFQMTICLLNLSAETRQRSSVDMWMSETLKSSVNHSVANADGFGWPISILCCFAWKLTKIHIEKIETKHFQKSNQRSGRITRNFTVAHVWLRNIPLNRKLVVFSCMKALAAFYGRSHSM